MKNNLYSRLREALKQSNIDSLERLYNENPGNLEIKFEYAKRVKVSDIRLSKQLIIELINNVNFKNRCSALIELGIIERKMGNYIVSRKYFDDVLNNDTANETDKEYAKLEMGKLEKEIGNVNEALRLFNELKKSSIYFYAYLELGIIEFERGNNDNAREYFENLLNSKRSLLAKLWLGKIEASEGRYLQAIIYLNELKGTPYGKKASVMIEEIRRMQLEERKLDKVRR